jgi:hypothetical protein
MQSRLYMVKQLLPHLKLFVDTRHYYVIVSSLQGKRKRKRKRKGLDTRQVFNKQLTLVSPIHIH